MRKFCCLQFEVSSRFEFIINANQCGDIFKFKSAIKFVAGVRERTKAKRPTNQVIAEKQPTKLSGLLTRFGARGQRPTVGDGDNDGDGDRAANGQLQWVVPGLVMSSCFTFIVSALDEARRVLDDFSATYTHRAPKEIYDFQLMHVHAGVCVCLSGCFIF